MAPKSRLAESAQATILKLLLLSHNVWWMIMAIVVVVVVVVVVAVVVVVVVVVLVFVGQRDSRHCITLQKPAQKCSISLAFLFLRGRPKQPACIRQGISN